MSNDNPLYAPSNQQGGILEHQLARGTISFKTCSRYMLIPVSFLIQLLKVSYSSHSEHCDIKAAVHTWLLTEILDGIGTYTTF